jgi:hypothetical protein
MGPVKTPEATPIEATALPITPSSLPISLRRSRAVLNPEFLTQQASRYRQLAQQLKAEFADLDDDTLKDTLEGLTNLPEMLEEVIRSSLDDETFILALKTRIDLLTVRLDRFKDRYDRKRKHVSLAMGAAQLDKFEVPDFSVNLNKGHTKLLVTADAKVPEAYLQPQPPKLDRVALTNALKRGETVEGASLAPGEPYITVRAR